ncbi:MAG: Asp-tRNA(Asn)/Glu-tRNA(Gln) amidotransferase subunit GatC [Akkermansia sp.]|nr:Asp-tRNA(Asn)/Glu-tRNA(Gln) amidotransferase subunit GatC [Akkermansia sp.]
MDTQALIDVAYIAKLAKVELTAEETERFSGDLNQVLAYVQQLEKWDTSAVEPMYHPLPVFDALRPEIPGESLSNEAAMANAPQQEDGQVRVPKVVESAH